MTVVADTSVILNLCWLGESALLQHLFTQVLAPDEVKNEFENLAGNDPRFDGLIFPEWVRVVRISSVATVLSKAKGLDAGELATISLALERSITTVLIDERAARAVATSLFLRPFGLLGILIESKKKELLPAVMPLLQRLRSEAGFWISDELCERIAVLTGE